MCYWYCCVPDCSCCSKTHPDLSFHTFPANIEIRRKWFDAVFRGERKNLVIRTRGQLVVCSRHFTSGDFLPAGNRICRRLRSKTVPSIFPWSNQSTGGQPIKPQSPQSRTSKSRQLETKRKARGERDVVKARKHDYVKPASTGRRFYL